MTQTVPETGRPIAILFANLKGNLGDFAILHAMLATISAHYPGRRIDVYAHPLPSVDQERTDAFRREAPAYEYCGPSHGTRLKSPILMALKLGIVPGGLASVVDYLAKKWAPEFRSYETYEAVYFAGGEQWNGRRLGALMFGTLGALKRVGVPVYSFPFSVKPKMSKLYSGKGIKRLFSMLERPIVVRDAATAAFFTTSSLMATVGIDSVFALETEVVRVEPAQGRNPERVLLAATGSYKDLAATASALLAAGHVVETITTCEPEDGDHLVRLRDEFGIPYHAPLTWQAFVAELKACKLVVTNRLHGLIFSTLAKAPVFPVANRQKVRAFVADAKIRHHSTGLLEIDARMIADAIAGRDETRDQMTTYTVRSHDLLHSPLREA